jgi:hypothetical protein
MVKPEERGHYGDLDIGVRIILKLILEIGCGGMDWISLAQNRDLWSALVNTVMNFWVPYIVGNF